MSALTAVPSKQERENAALVALHRTNHALACESLSFTERMLLHVAHMKGQNLIELIGNPMLKVLGPALQMFEKMMGQMEQEQVAAMLAAVREQLNEQARQELAVARVGSFSELRRKQEQLDILEAGGKQIFFASPQNLELMQERDVAMVVAGKGSLSHEDAQIISEYWTLIRRAPQLLDETHRQLERFLGEVVAFQAQITSSLDRSVEKPQLVQSYREKMEAFLLQGRERLIAASTDLPQRQQILANYSILQANLMLPALVNFMIRKFAGGLACQVEQEIKGMSSFWSSFYQRHLAEDAAKLAECKSRQERMQKALEQKIFSEEETEEDLQFELEQILPSSIRIYESQCQKMRHKLVHFDDQMHEMYGNPDEIRGAAPRQTTYERVMADLLGFSQLMENGHELSGQAAASSHIRLDLSTLTPQYFADELASEAERWRDRLHSTIQVALLD